MLPIHVCADLHAEESCCFEAELMGPLLTVLFFMFAFNSQTSVSWTFITAQVEAAHSATAGKDGSSRSVRRQSVPLARLIFLLATMLLPISCAGTPPPPAARISTCSRSDA